jgi:antitoxin component of MazEF toxin-antitoxin module
MTFQPGNTIAKDRRAPKPYRDALMMQLKEAGTDHRGLRRIAQKVLELAYEGESWAVQHVAERIDGKVPQALIDADDGQQITLQVVKYVIEQPTLETHTLTLDNEIKDITPTVSHNQSSGKPTEGKD